MLCCDQDKKRTAVSQLGITLEMVESKQVAAADLSDFAVLCGWVSVERRGKLYDDFKKYWAVLWREPPDEQAPAVHEPEPEPEPGSLTASHASDFDEDDPRRLDPNFANLPVHEGVTCDKCGMVPIRGVRFNKSDKNFDMCGLVCFPQLLPVEKQGFVEVRFNSILIRFNSTLIRH